MKKTIIKKPSNWTISYNNHQKAWNYFKAQGLVVEGLHVLHHKDIEMKDKDYQRYIQWRIEDLVPMTKQQHRSFHMKLQNPKGSKISKAHKNHIKQALKKAIRGKIIKIFRPAVEQIEMEFESMADAAKFIGCSRQLISQCVNDKQSNKTACGYYISIEDKEIIS